MHPSSHHSVSATGPPGGEDSKAKKPILAQRFRTKLCNKFATTGSCPYVHRCMFAHGKDELRTAGQNVADGLVSEEAIRAFKREQYEARATGGAHSGGSSSSASRGGGTAMPAASVVGVNPAAAPFGLTAPLPSAAAALAGTSHGHPTSHFVVQGGAIPPPPAAAAAAAAAAGIDPYFALFPGVLSPFAAPPAMAAPPPMSWLPQEPLHTDQPNTPADGHHDPHGFHGRGNARGNSSGGRKSPAADEPSLSSPPTHAA